MAQGNQPDEGLAALGDDNILAGQSRVDQFGQVGLRRMTRELLRYRRLRRIAATVTLWSS
jgi:hypothetical protein